MRSPPRRELAWASNNSHTDKGRAILAKQKAANNTEKKPDANDDDGDADESAPDSDPVVSNAEDVFFSNGLTSS